MDYRQLLKKYINHVGIEEGTTFLTIRGGWNDSPEFTDEEWAKLKELEAEPLVISKETHNCSCHAKDAGACPICKELGCLVWDFNQIAPNPALFEIGVDHGELYLHDHTTPLFLVPSEETQKEE